MPAAVATGVVVTDSTYIVTGVVADSVPPFRIGNFYSTFDLEGVPLMHKLLTNPEKTFETWEKPTLLPDGSLIMPGHSSETGMDMKIILLKFNKSGDTVLHREYAHPLSPDPPQDGFMRPKGGLAVTPEGGFVIASTLYSSQFDSDVYLLCTDSEGNVKWDSIYNTPLLDLPQSMAPDGQGNFIVGSMNFNYGLVFENFVSQVHLSKINGDGEVLWEYTTPESAGLRDAPNDMVLLDDGSLVIASGAGTEIERPTGNTIKFEKLLFKLSPDHEIEWEVEFPDVELNGSAKLTNVIRLSDGSGFVTAGMEGKDLPGNDTYAVRGWLAKVSPEGTPLWTRRYVGIGGNYPTHTVYALKECPDGGFILVGESQDGTGDTYPSQQAWLLKLDEHGCLVPGCHLTDAAGEAERPEAALAIHPNPVSDYLNFQLRGSGLPQEGEFRIADMTGRAVAQFRAGLGANDTYIVPAWDWPPGNYVLQYLDGEGRTVAAEQFVVAHR